MARLFVTVLAGALLLAGPVSAAEDPRDSAVVTPLVKQTLEFERTGVEVPWSNPKTGNRGVIRVERTYFSTADKPCRDYIRTSEGRGGERSATKGTGCRLEDGRWFLDEQSTAEALPGPKGKPAGASPRDDDKAERTDAPTDLTPAKQDAKGKAAEKNSKTPTGDAKATAASPAAPESEAEIAAPSYTMPSRSEL